MKFVTVTENYNEPPVSLKEILRYAGVKEASDEMKILAETCLREARQVLNYKVCFCELPFETDGRICDFGLFRAESRKLSKNLEGSEKVLLFAATAGMGIDRLIEKYSRISPSKALMLEAVGTERAEALCDEFCRDIEIKKNIKLKPRFSPGYGDLSLGTQRDIFNILDCQRKIGLYLNESLLMIPSKSVTAIAGISENKKNEA